MKAKLLALLSAIILPQAARAACTITLNPGENISSAVSSASPGSTVCLNAGNHNALNLSGVSKNPRVTVQSASGQTAVLSFTFQNGTKGITLNSLTLNESYVYNTARDITVSNSIFKARIVFDGVANANILLDRNIHNNIAAGGWTVKPARIHLPYSGSSHSGVTIQNSVFDGGSSDGVQSGTAVNIINNEFKNIREGSCSDCHTDAIQFYGGPFTGSVIRGNYFYNNSTHITSFGPSVQGVLIEDNVIDAGPAGRPWCIEWYSDVGSTIRHNTCLYRANCAYGLACGQIDLNRKSNEPAGRGTVVVDNIATSINGANGSTWAERHHNLVRSGAVSGDLTGSPSYTGGSLPSTWVGFGLTSSSLGVGAASDRMNIGARTFGSSAPTEPPPPPPASCTFNNQAIASGASVTAYQAASVPYGQSCVSQSRVCTNGVLSGSYAFASCSVQPQTPPPPPPPSGSQNLFASAVPVNKVETTDRSAVELGMKFRSSVDGKISGIRFYRGQENSVGYKVSLWSSSGQLLASASVSASSAGAGWRQASFASPVAIKAGTVYVASYFTSNGQYAYLTNGFSSAVTSGSLTALASTSSSGNGVYRYSSSSAFPNQTWRATNYYVDVMFSADASTSPQQPQPQQPAASCSFNGQTIASGASVTAYQAASVPFGQSCISQSRVCTNGVLSGSYTFASCSVQAQQPAPQPPAGSFEWPNANNTGVPAGVTLTNYTGPMTITTIGTVIDGKIINGMLRINAANVVIKNSRIVTNDYYGIYGEDATNLTVQDCDILGSGTTVGGAGIHSSGTFLRNDISRTENGIDLLSGSSTVKGNYIHDLQAGGSDPHYDGIAVQGGQNGVLIEDNYISARDTSDIIIQNAFGAVNNVTVNHNYLTGTPGLNVYVEGRFAGSSTTNVRITNNIMKKGSYGYIAIDKASPYVAGNVDAVTGATVP